MHKLSTIELEKRSVFYINSFLIILMIILFLFEIHTKYFFYFNIFLTLGLSYIFFKHSKKLSKYIIITNMFIFFYFLFPKVADFLYQLLGNESYIFLLFYNIFLAYIFLLFSGQHKNFLRNIKKTNIKVIGITILIGIILGIFFFFVREPIPQEFLTGDIVKIVFYTFILALSEQIMFAGFLFNTYKELTSQTKEAYFQVATVFLLFHLLRFENLVVAFWNNFEFSYLYLMTGYYILLFIFMAIALYLYNFKTSKYEGNFIYPVLLHFITDFILIFLIIFTYT